MGQGTMRKQRQMTASISGVTVRAHGYSGPMRSSVVVHEPGAAGAVSCGVSAAEAGSPQVLLLFLFLNVYQEDIFSF